MITTSYADAMLAHPDVRRELRCYRGREIPAARLLGAAFSDVHFVECGLVELVQRGVLHPIRHAPWFGTPIVSPNIGFGCAGSLKSVDNAEFAYRRSHAMTWTYRVSWQPLACVPWMWRSDRRGYLALWPKLAPTFAHDMRHAAGAVERWWAWRFPSTPAPR